jgi:hypothetical protein
VRSDPRARAERPDQRAIDLPLRSVVDILDARVRDSQLRLAQGPREPLVVARQMLGVDQHPEAPVEIDFVHLRIFALFRPRRRHRWCPSGFVRAELRPSEGVSSWDRSQRTRGDLRRRSLAGAAKTQPSSHVSPLNPPRSAHFNAAPQLVRNSHCTVSASVEANREERAFPTPEVPWRKK